MKSVIKYTFLYLIFAMVITIVWQMYEKKVYGEIYPDMFDSVIAIALSVSLTINVFLYKKLMKNVG